MVNGLEPSKQIKWVNLILCTVTKQTNSTCDSVFGACKIDLTRKLLK